MKSRFLFSIFGFNGTGIEFQLFYANDKVCFITIFSRARCGFRTKPSNIGRAVWSWHMAAIAYKPIQA